MTASERYFSKLVCDASSISETYLSNHTLESLGIPLPDHPTDLVSSMNLNASNEDKEQVARMKTLQHHSHCNIQPFFEWEFKVLPLMIAWFEKAATCTTTFEEKLNKMKLSVTYDFVREFPMLYIEPVTRKEIEDCTALEKQLQGDKCRQAELEDIQQRKARSLRRL